MRTNLLKLLLFFCIISFGQNNIPLKSNLTYINASAAYTAKDHQKTITLGNQIIDNYFLEPDLYALIGKAYLFSGKYPEAVKYLKIAHELEPIHDDFILFYLVAIGYNKETYNISKVYNDFSFFGMPKSSKDYNNSYIDNVINSLRGATGYQPTVDAMTNAKNKYNSDYIANATIFGKEAAEIYELPIKNKSEINATEITKKLFSLKTRVANNTFPASFYNQLLLYVAGNAIDEKNRDIILEELFFQFKNTNNSPFIRYKMYNLLADIYQIKRQYDDGISIANIMFDDISKISLSTSMNVKPLNRKMFALIGLGKYKEALDVAKNVESVFNKITNTEEVLDAYLQTSRAYSLSGEKEKGVQLAEKAEVISKNLNYQITDLGKEITKNLDRAKGLNGEKIDRNHDINSSDYLALYNDGLSLIGSRKYNEAISFLEKSNKLYKEILNQANAKDRNALLLFSSNVGGHLVACYQETKQFDKIFPIMESLKANSLVSKLNVPNEKLITLSQLQQTLKSDEAIVYYTEVTRGSTREGTYIAAVITKESYNTRYVVSHGALMNIYVKYNKLIGEIENEMAQKEYRSPKYTQYNSVQEAGTNELRKGEVSLLIELYRKFLNPTEGGKIDQRFTNEMDFGIISNSFYIDYLSKLEPYFKGKKKVIFALDGMQNLIPFESLVDMNSAYMVEKYDIAYIPSGTILKTIRDRKPNTYTKNILAFGDAKYAKLQNQGMTLKSLADIDRLRNQVYDLQKENKPLDYAFATFSKEPMKYLNGAKAEVEYIGEKIQNSDVKMGDLMTENEFKRMSNAGELKNYKTIHLSSHAMVHPYIFDLSSIAFSVFPTPKDNEDGMLTVSEMEKLNIKTDFMMLSACQTGLGKIVPGDGIAGLNQSMLTAGANSTVSTLWSVNDYGSYIFTANLYHKVFNLGMDYNKAVNEVKRDFIKGSYNKDSFNGKEVKYWAPFIYHGK